MPLFDDVPQVELSPAQLARVAAQRAAWRTRQRRCRAARKMTPLEKLTARTQVAAAIREKEKAQLVFDDEGAELSTVMHEWFFLRAMQLGGWIARQIFESVKPQDFTQESHRLIFSAAAKIHARGHVVSIAGLHAQFKRDNVVLGDISCFALGNLPLEQVSPDVVEEHARELKAA